MCHRTDSDKCYKKKHERERILKTTSAFCIRHDIFIITKRVHPHEIMNIKDHQKSSYKIYDRHLCDPKVSKSHFVKNVYKQIFEL
jgi:hypothetical protein